MNKYGESVKALFIAPDGGTYPDYLVCSGRLLLETNGHSCPYSQNGRVPDAKPLNASDANYSIDKGKPGDLCPPCVKQQLASLEHWETHRGITYPEELKRLRLFKCNQWLWLVIIGLYDDKPTQIIGTQG